LGAKSSDPSVDNDGNALTTGDQYFNTVSNELRVWNGSSWQAASVIGGTVTNLTVTNGATIQGLTVGKGAGAVSTNTAVGASALAANTTGSLNTAFGYNALTLADANNNSAFGYNALSANTSGTPNSAFGRSALASNTTGASNTGIGYGAIQSNTTGGSNVGVGHQALVNNTTASNNTAVGYQAGYSNTTSSANTLVGYQAGYSTTTSFGDVNAFGWRALYSNTTGYSNTAMGSEALRNNTTANNNTAVGYQAAYSNTTGGITAFGYQAGYANVTGLRCVFLGRGAGFSSTGDNNTFVGYGAGNSSTGVNNTFVGGYNSSFGASGGDMTTGSKNTILGTYTGNQGSLDIRTASNYIVLSDGDGNPRGIFDSSGNFLVGATSLVSAGKIEIATSAATNQGLNIKDTSGSNNLTYCAFFNSSGTVAGTITHTGSTTVAYNTSSDYRLKENIAQMTGDLNTVAQLKPVTYKWKEDQTAGQGFIAHELQAVVPDCVTGAKDAVDEDGKPVYQGIDVSFLVATLTAAIQELKAEFDAYKATHP
jgi:hypothetical protein